MPRVSVQPASKNRIKTAKMDLATQNAPFARFPLTRLSQAEDVFASYLFETIGCIAFSLYFDAPPRPAAAVIAFMRSKLEVFQTHRQFANALPCSVKYRVADCSVGSDIGQLTQSLHARRVDVIVNL